MTRLVQLTRNGVRRVGIVDEPGIRLIEDLDSVYELAGVAASSGRSLVEVVRNYAGSRHLSYDDVLRGADAWQMLPPVDHPRDPARCVVSGTGLTHLGSVARRDAMHVKSASSESELTDSMRMFRWGVEGGKPAPGEIGTSPEWFYKGDGSILRGCGESLTSPWFAEDGGEEPEIAGAYLIDPHGQPLRLGLATGNEFSDHKFEKRNYLYLASSKLRECALGPELVIGEVAFEDVPGVVRVDRDGAPLWSADIRTGEANMCHSLANMEHHHFKFPQHCRPGDIHVHFFGADAFSFGSGIELRTGDVMHVQWDGFGRALRNRITVQERAGRAQVAVRSL